MRLRLLHWISLFASLYGSLAVPLHDVNDFNYKGDTCPTYFLPRVACPVLCVKSPTVCEEYATCPQGQSLCPATGLCETDSDCPPGNICACRGSDDAVSLEWTPCLQKFVDLPRFNSTIKDQLTSAACLVAFGVFEREAITTGDPSDMSDIDDDHVWLKCGNELQHIPLDSPQIWFFIILLMTEALLLISWIVWKPILERNQLSSLNIKNSPNTEVKSNVSAIALRSHPFGSFVFFSIAGMSVMWLVILSICVADHYGALTGSLDGLFGIKEATSIAFVVVWHLSSIWYLFIAFYSTRLKNYFRVRINARELEMYGQALKEKNRSTGLFIQIEEMVEKAIYLDDGSRLIQWVRELEATVRKRVKFDERITTVSLLYTDVSNPILYFTYERTRYLAHTASCSFEPFHVNFDLETKALHNQAIGLTSRDSEFRLEMCGRNFIQVEVPSFLKALSQELRSTFYLYQLMTLFVWYFLDYYYMGLVQTFVIIISAVIKITIRLKSERKVKEMAEHRSYIKALRDGAWTLIGSERVVPGDIIDLEVSHLVPCDCILLSGDAVLDEASLTGEPLPIRKVPLPNNLHKFSHSTHKHSILHAGTLVLQVSSLDDSNDLNSGCGKVMALVKATGTLTSKGQMVKQMLFPTPVSFVFDEHLKVVIVILLLWGIVAFGLAVWEMGGSTPVNGWFYGIFIISQILSPLLPAALVVGQSNAALRLRAKKISCINLPRITIAGKIKVFCFDKTGTLTRDGLEFYGAQEVVMGNGQVKFGLLEEDVGNISGLLKMGMGTCHAVAEVDSHLVGNPVDIEMWRSTNYRLSPPLQDKCVNSIIARENGVDVSYHIIKRFEFIHARASMAAVVMDPATRLVHVFVKGSFEKLSALANADSIPEDYDKVASAFALQGCYVLAIGHKVLGHYDEVAVQIPHMARDEVEQGISVTALLCFKNKLRDDTSAALEELKEGNVRAVMITGDNALTAVHIGRACGMVNSSRKVFLGDVDKKSLLVVWKDVDSGATVTDINTALVKFNADLAVTGHAFDVLNRGDIIRDILFDIRIFARMTPEGKVTCVRLHMEKATVGMCGDGGNDCGALRAAHVGVALSEAEASIVASFSTKTMYVIPFDILFEILSILALKPSSLSSIFSCVEILKEGRAALATSFANYKFLIMYGEILAFFALALYYFSVVSSQATWIMIDGFVTVGLSWALTLSRPAARLSPFRPTARLLGTETLASCLSQIFVNCSFLVLAITLLFQQPWFLCNEFDSLNIDTSKWWLLGDNFEAEVLVLIVMYQLINAAAVFNFGYHFRASWWKNYIFVAFYVVMMSFSSFLTLAPPNSVSCLFRINCGDSDVLESLGYPKPTYDIPAYNNPRTRHNVLPMNFRLTLWIIGMVNSSLNLWIEKFMILGSLRIMLRKTTLQLSSKAMRLILLFSTAVIFLLFLCIVPRKVDSFEFFDQFFEQGSPRQERNRGNLNTKTERDETICTMYECAGGECVAKPIDCPCTLAEKKCLRGDWFLCVREDCSCETL